jgi:hypothetical protein
MSEPGPLDPPCGTSYPITSETGNSHPGTPVTAENQGPHPSGRNMKRRLIYITLAVIVLIAADFMRSAAGRYWKSIQAGMTEVDVRSKLGKPSKDAFKSKRIQIWTNEGFIRSSSLAVFYYDPEHPSIVTGTHEGTRWIWERL